MCSPNSTTAYRLCRRAEGHASPSALGSRRCVEDEDADLPASAPLFTTLLRKCNRNRLVDFPELWDYACTLYQVPSVAETVPFDPTRVVAERSIFPRLASEETYR